MQKFPLRMKDNDLLITELYRDPNADVITAISVYLTPKTSLFLPILTDQILKLKFHFFVAPVSPQIFVEIGLKLLMELQVVASE